MPVGARTGRSCDLVSAASAMSLESMGSCEDMGKVPLRPCVDPGAVLATALKTLAACNVAKRLELDWQAQNEVAPAPCLQPAWTAAVT